MDNLRKWMWRLARSVIGPRGRIFVSFSSTDMDVVRKVTDRLRASGLSIWIDREQLIIGTRRRRRTAEAIRDADFFLFLYSDSALNSPHVRWELEVARPLVDDRPEFVLPARLRRCTEPLPEWLSDSSLVDLTDPTVFDESLNQLTQQILQVAQSYRQSVREKEKAQRRSARQRQKAARLRRKKGAIRAHYDGIGRVIELFVTSVGRRESKMWALPAALFVAIVLASATGIEVGTMLDSLSGSEQAAPSVLVVVPPGFETAGAAVTAGLAGVMDVQTFVAPAGAPPVPQVLSEAADYVVTLSSSHAQWLLHTQGDNPPFKLLIHLGEAGWAANDHPSVLVTLGFDPSYLIPRLPQLLEEAEFPPVKRVVVAQWVTPQLIDVLGVENFITLHVSDLSVVYELNDDPTAALLLVGFSSRDVRRLRETGFASPLAVLGYEPISAYEYLESVFIIGPLTSTPRSEGQQVDQPLQYHSALGEDAARLIRTLSEGTEGEAAWIQDRIRGLRAFNGLSGFYDFTSPGRGLSVAGIRTYDATGTLTYADTVPPPAPAIDHGHWSFAPESSR